MKCWWLAAIALGGAPMALAQDVGESQTEHVPPDAPQSHVHSMPYREMSEMMGMDDRRRFAKVMVDRLEWQDGDRGGQIAWDAAAWYGGDFNKVWVSAEGERAAGATGESRLELAWDRIVTRWWSTRLGWRHDAGIGPSRDWAAFGLAGLAPGFVDVEASVYLGDSGRSALRLTTRKDYLFTQRLVLQPELELEAYGSDDPQRLIGSGLSNLKLGLRLRYEWRREIAPFVGIRWVGHFGETSDLRRAAGESTDELLWLAGIRAWL
jgi:copper resistance protein B